MSTFGIIWLQVSFLGISTVFMNIDLHWLINVFCRYLLFPKISYVVAVADTTSFIKVQMAGFFMPSPCFGCPFGIAEGRPSGLYSMVERGQIVSLVVMTTATWWSCRLGESLALLIVHLIIFGKHCILRKLEL